MVDSPRAGVIAIGHLLHEFQQFIIVPVVNGSNVKEELFDFGIRFHIIGVSGIGQKFTGHGKGQSLDLLLQKQRQHGKGHLTV